LKDNDPIDTLDTGVTKISRKACGDPQEVDERFRTKESGAAKAGLSSCRVQEVQVKVERSEPGQKERVTPKMGEMIR
jgi:hypothetical protein